MSAQHTILVTIKKKNHIIPQSAESCELSSSATLCSSLALSSVFNSEL